MVRAYTPQRSPGSISSNTNYPPQSSDESGGTPPIGVFEAFSTGSESGLISYDDGAGNSGNIIVSEGE